MERRSLEKLGGPRAADLIPIELDTSMVVCFICFLFAALFF